jgi:hypothetical protein
MLKKKINNLGQKKNEIKDNASEIKGDGIECTVNGKDKNAFSRGGREGIKTCALL